MRVPLPDPRLPDTCLTWPRMKGGDISRPRKKEISRCRWRFLKDVDASVLMMIASAKTTSVLSPMMIACAKTTSVLGPMMIASTKTPRRKWLKLRLIKTIYVLINLIDELTSECITTKYNCFLYYLELNNDRLHIFIITGQARPGCTLYLLCSVVFS